MADFIYFKFNEALNSGFAFDPLTATIKMVGVNETGGGTMYVPDQDTHAFLSDVPLASRMGTVTVTGITRTANLTTKRSVLDVPAGISVPTFTAPKVDSLVFYVDTGVEATSRLICRYDSWTGLPIASGLPGGPFFFTVPVDANKLLAIGKGA
jgi:hypothetical protein